MTQSKFKNKTEEELKEMHAERQQSMNEINERLQQNTREFTDDVPGAAGAQAQDDVGVEDVRESHMRAQAAAIDSIRQEQREIYDEIQQRKNRKTK